MATETKEIKVKTLKFCEILAENIVLKDGSSEIDIEETCKKLKDDRNIDVNFEEIMSALNFLFDFGVFGVGIGDGDDIKRSFELKLDKENRIVLCKA